jgi:hypothetical protein
MAFFRATMFFRDVISGNEYRNTFIGSSPTEVAFRSEVCGVALANAWQIMKLDTPARIEYYKVTTQNLDAPQMPIIPYGITPSFGSSTFDPYASTVGALLIFRSNTARPNQKRMYVIPVTENSINSGQMTGPYITNLNGLAGGLLGFAISPGYQSDLGCARLRPDGTVLLYNTWDSFTLSPQLAVQRRRKIGVGI